MYFDEFQCIFQKYTKMAVLTLYRISYCMLTLALQLLATTKVDDFKTLKADGIDMQMPIKY